MKKLKLLYIIDSIGDSEEWQGFAKHGQICGFIDIASNGRYHWTGKAYYWDHNILMHVCHHLSHRSQPSKSPQNHPWWKIQKQSSFIYLKIELSWSCKTAAAIIKTHPVLRWEKNSLKNSLSFPVTSDGNLLRRGRRLEATADALPANPFFSADHRLGNMAFLIFTCVQNSYNHNDI